MTQYYMPWQTQVFTYSFSQRKKRSILKLSVLKQPPEQLCSSEAKTPERAGVDEVVHGDEVVAVDEVAEAEVGVEEEVTATGKPEPRRTLPMARKPLAKSVSALLNLMVALTLVSAEMLHLQRFNLLRGSRRTRALLHQLHNFPYIPSFHDHAYPSTIYKGYLTSFTKCNLVHTWAIHQDTLTVTDIVIVLVHSLYFQCTL